MDFSKVGKYTSEQLKQLEVEQEVQFDYEDKIEIEIQYKNGRKDCVDRVEEMYVYHNILNIYNQNGYNYEYPLDDIIEIEIKQMKENI